MEIDELNKEITAWKVADAQKEIKLDLFKKTISNLQTQLQDKASLITQLESSLNDKSDSTQIHNLNQLISEKDKHLETMNSTLEDLSTQLQARTSQLDDLHKLIERQTETTISKSTEIDALKVTVHQQVQSITQLEADNLSLRQELQMKTNLVDNSQAELLLLRQELAIYKTRLDEQVQLIVETENELQRQLEFSKPQESLEDNTPRVIGHSQKKTHRGDPKRRR
jgi:predicted  nucleic acid-binding Zn-ribbon protein